MRSGNGSSGYQPTTKPNYVQIRKLVEAVSGAKKPVILAGAGVLHANASDLLREYAEQQGLPVIHTLLGLGGFPANHPQFVGIAGMHGCYQRIWRYRNVIYSSISALDLTIV